MDSRPFNKRPVIENIEKQIRTLNIIFALSVYVMLFLIIRFLYLILSYIPTASLVVMITIVAGLMVAGLYFSNKISKKAINELSAYYSKLDSLFTTTKAIRETKYGDILLESIMDNAMQMTNAEAGSILLVDEDALVFKIFRGPASKQLTGLCIPKNQGIAGWVMENASVIRINDVRADNRFSPHVDAVTGYETRSILAVPLRLNSEVIGVIELLNNRTPEGFAIDDESVISYFADHAAISLEMTRYFDDQKNLEIHLTNLLVDSIDHLMPDKRGHSRNVAQYSLLIGKAINMSEDEKRKLYRACLLHDIGLLKIRVDEVKSKEEFKAHAVLGYNILQSINLYKDIAPLVLYHHERYDGLGYPEKLKGELIPLESRIIGISEAFDSMVNKTSYKVKGKSFANEPGANLKEFDDAVKELKLYAGTQFDPELVNIFVDNIAPSLLE